MAQAEPQLYGELYVDGDGSVQGAIYTDKHNGYSVQACVTSYRLGGRYDADMNHVPSIVVEQEDGGTVSVHARDSTSAQAAIENARSTAQWAIKNAEKLDRQ